VSSNFFVNGDQRAFCCQEFLFTLKASKQEKSFLQTLWQMISKKIFDGFKVFEKVGMSDSSTNSSQSFSSIIHIIEHDCQSNTRSGDRFS
jgi:hypothetical protein